jgi:hypothetical protein
MIAETLSPPSPPEVGERLKIYWDARKPRMAGRRQIAFYGGSFTSMPRERQHAYLEVCRPYLRQRRVDSVRISTRPDEVSEGQLAFLADRGVKTVELGIQSLSDRVLRASRRGYTAEVAREAIHRTREAGMEVGVQLMVGLPEDGGKESLETAEALPTLAPDFVRIYPLLVLEQTELAERTRRGEYKPLGLEAAVALCTVMLQRLEEASIPVVRIGLQEQQGMGGDGSFVLAGPYHPAFGHLVRSALFLQKVLRSLPREIAFSSGLCLRVHPDDRSLLMGDHRQNFRKLQSHLEPRAVRIEEDRGLARGAVQWRAQGSGIRGQGSGIRPRTPARTRTRKAERWGPEG